MSIYLYVYIYIHILPPTTSNQYHWKNSTLSSSMASELLTRKPTEILSLELLIHVPLPIQCRKLPKKLTVRHLKNWPNLKKKTSLLPTVEVLGTILGILELLRIMRCTPPSIQWMRGGWHLLFGGASLEKPNLNTFLFHEVIASKPQYPEQFITPLNFFVTNGYPPKIPPRIFIGGYQKALNF